MDSKVQNSFRKVIYAFIGYMSRIENKQKDGLCGERKEAPS